MEEEIPDVLVISCFPVDCPENRAWVQSLGVLPDSIPWMVYPGSVQGECQDHHGPVWIGPQQQRIIRKTRQQGGAIPPVICHICATIMAQEMDVDINLLKLSDKNAVEPRQN